MDLGTDDMDEVRSPLRVGNSSSNLILSWPHVTIRAPVAVLPTTVTTSHVVASESWQCGQSESAWAVSINYAPDFKDFLRKGRM